MGAPLTDKHDATAALTGYLYQCRYALVSGLEYSYSKPSFSVSVERFDDVAFGDEKAASDLIQTKHHCKPGNLSDKSVDVWKTLAIWIGKVAADPQAAFETAFMILTTSTAPAGSAAEALRRDPEYRNADAALNRLMSAATASSSQATEAARQAFLEMLPEIRKSLVNAIFVIDQAPNITDMRGDLEAKLFAAAPQKHLCTFVDYLEGWWFAQIIKSLSNPSAPPIPVLSIRQKIDELREQFQTDKLPVDDFDVEPPSDEAVAADTRLFVRQMQLIGLRARVIANSIADFYRASTQRSKWARENLLLDGEAERYDRKLIDRWRREFDANTDSIATADEESRKSVGQTTFHWANRASLPFRNRDEVWLSAGSFQILAEFVTRRVAP